GSGHAAGTCGTQLVPHQFVEIMGTRGRIHVAIPFNTPPDEPCRLLIDDGSDLHGAGITTLEIDACNQYTVQADGFARAIPAGPPAPYPLEDSAGNIRVLDAIWRAAESGRQEPVEQPGSA